MAWTTPATWTPGQLVAASDLNTHLRDNLLYLFNGRPKSVIKRDNNANYSTSSTTFVDVDATNLAISLAIASGNALVGFMAVTSNNVQLDIDVDGTRYANGAADGLVTGQDASSTRGGQSGCVLVTGLSVASHTFKLKYKVTTGTGTLYSGAGVGGTDFMTVFWAMEIG
jgi:hypothetical protein